MPDRPTERGSAPPSQAGSDHRETACFEVHYGACVFGPMTLSKIRSGLAAGQLPAWALVRRVTPWLPIDYVRLLGVPPGKEHHKCLEVRLGADVRGPVSLDQLRRGLGAAMIPAASEVRVVWALQTLEMALHSYGAAA